MVHVPELSFPTTKNMSILRGYLTKIAFENRSYLGEFEAEFQMALACEAGAQGVLFYTKKSRVENLVTLSL
jgi:hypothetical protein